MLPSIAGAPSPEFRVLMGPIGSGEAVMASEIAEDRLWLSAVNDKCLGVETEAGGVGQAFYEDDAPTSLRVEGCLIIRGMSDYADPSKNDSVRTIAARHAIRFLRDFLKDLPPLRYAKD